VDAVDTVQHSATIVDWIPLLVAAISIVGAAAIYAYQRSIDRSDKLREKRQAIYEQYLHSLFIAATQADPQKNKHNDRYQLAKLSMFVLAPDDVVRAAGKHQQLIQTGNSPKRNAKSEAFAKLILEMRSDAFESSGLSIDDVVSLSPISHSND